VPDGYRLTDDDRLTSAERRKRDAAQTPIVLYGTPSAEELAAARGRAGSRGVLVVPEEMRNEGLLVGNIDGAADQARDEYRASHADEPYAGDAEKAWKAVANSCDDVIRATLQALGFEADTDPVLAARKRMRQLEEAKAATRDDEPERTYNDETTLAPEPIEERLRRAYENGLKQGLELAHRAYGRWDS
jgi:hypothetical protein